MSSAAAQARVTAPPHKFAGDQQSVQSWTRGGIAWRKVPVVMLDVMRRWLKPGTYHVLTGLFVLADCENDWITIEHPRSKARVPANKTKLWGILGISDDAYRPAISELEEMGLLREEKFGREKRCRLTIERWPTIARELLEQERAGAEAGPTKRGPKPGSKVHRPRTTSASAEEAPPQQIELEPGKTDTLESDDISVECVNELPIRVSVTVVREENVLRVSLGEGAQKGEHTANETTGDEKAKDSAKPAFEGHTLRVSPVIPPSPNVARRPPDQAAAPHVSTVSPNTVNCPTQPISEQKENAGVMPGLVEMLVDWGRLSPPPADMLTQISDALLSGHATPAELRQRLIENERMFAPGIGNWGGVRFHARKLAADKLTLPKLQPQPTSSSEDEPVTADTVDAYDRFAGAAVRREWESLEGTEHRKELTAQAKRMAKQAGLSGHPNYDEYVEKYALGELRRLMLADGRLQTLEQWRRTRHA